MGQYRYTDSGGQTYTFGLGEMQMGGDRYQYVTAGSNGVAFYSLHPVSGNVYLATQQSDKGATAINAVVLRIYGDTVEYVFPPTSLVTSLAGRFGVRVSDTGAAYHTLNGNRYDQLALMREVAMQVSNEQPRTRCTRVYT